MEIGKEKITTAQVFVNKGDYRFTFTKKIEKVKESARYITERRDMEKEERMEKSKEEGSMREGEPPKLGDIEVEKPERENREKDKSETDTSRVKRKLTKRTNVIQS